MSVSCVVLLSGGLDSTVALAEVLAEPGILPSQVLALTFQYGQRAWEREWAATRSITAHYGVPHERIDLPWLANLLPAALTPREALNTPEAPVTEANLFETARVWAPNRNGIFLNIAAAFAEARCATRIVFGANADEAAGFPDNTQAYREKVTEALAWSTLNHVRVETPVGLMTKAEIISRAVALKAPLEFIWSCYEGVNLHCGGCPSCLLLRKAFVFSEQAAPFAFLAPETSVKLPA